jgi:hypothetical protein
VGESVEGSEPSLDKSKRSGNKERVSRRRRERVSGTVLTDEVLIHLGDIYNGRGVYESTNGTTKINKITNKVHTAEQHYTKDRKKTGLESSFNRVWGGQEGEVRRKCNSELVMGYGRKSW